MICILESTKHLPQLTPFQECLSPFLSLHLGSAIKLSICSSAILDKDAKSSRKQEQGRKENHRITALPLKITHRKLHSGNSMMSLLRLQKWQGIQAKHCRRERIFQGNSINVPFFENTCSYVAFWSQQCLLPWPCSSGKSKTPVQLSSVLRKQ